MRLVCRRAAAYVVRALLLLASLSSVQPKADFALYHTASSLFSQAAAIAERNSDVLTVSSCPFASPPIPLYTLTSSHSLSHLSTPKLRLLLNFGEHGRELITSETALTYLRFVDRLSRQTEREQRRAAGAPEREEGVAEDEFEYARYAEDENDVSDEFLRYLTRNSAATVLPLLNRWGHERVEAGEECSRKNARGVDLNRNWDFLWAQTAKAPQDETYAGPMPFSEEESRCLRDVAVALQPHVYVNVHSGIKELYFGWDHRGDAMIPNQREVTRLYERVNSFHCSCRVGSAGRIAGYVVYGGSMDWMYTQLNVSYSLTYELYGKEAAMKHNDCYAAFNPTTKEELQETAYRFASSFFTVQHALIEEKLGIPFPYRLPFFLRTPLHMQEDAKTRNAVRLYYHPWRLVLPRFPHSTSSFPSTSYPLPVYDPQHMVPTPSPSSPDIPLRVLLLADTQYNQHFTTELLLHLSHQMRGQPYERRVHVLMVPTLFPSSRGEDEWCWQGLDDAAKQKRAEERYRGEEEVERISRHVRPHLVIELRTSNDTTPQRRRRGDDFDILFHTANASASASDPAFVAATLAALSAIHAPVPFTSPLSITAHLHLLLIYRGWTATPDPEPTETRRRSADRLPPSSYLTQPFAPHAVVRCDWPSVNPEPQSMREHVTTAMRGMHRVMQAVAAVPLKGVGLAVVREEEYEEDEERSVLLNGEVMVVDVGGGAGWVPSVWESGGIGWRAWAALLALLLGLVLIVRSGWLWFKHKTRHLKAAEAV